MCIIASQISCFKYHNISIRTRRVVEGNLGKLTFQLKILGSQKPMVLPKGERKYNILTLIKNKMFLWRGCDVSEACWLLKNNYFQKEICQYKGSCAFVKGFHRLFIMSNQSPEMKMEPLDYCTHSASSRHRFLTQQCKILYQCISKSLMHICQMHFHKCGRRKSSRDFRAVEKHVSDKSRKILQSWLTVLSCVLCF